MLAADPLLAQLPPDLVERTRQVGAFFLEDPQPLPAEMEALLAASEPPVYLGFGSMVDLEPARTTREVVAAVRAAGVRALVSHCWAGLGEGPLPPELLAIGPVSHSALLPRLRAMVHHGGAGTTHAAARAGPPRCSSPTCWISSTGASGCALLASPPSPSSARGSPPGAWRTRRKRKLVDPDTVREVLERQHSPTLA